MTMVGVRARIIASSLALVTMAMYSGGDTASLVGTITGGALVMLGLWTMFRTAAVAGFLISAGTMAYFTELDTMTDVQSVLFALLALFLPTAVLGLATLTAEAEDLHPLELWTRQSAASAFFAGLCVASVPMAVLVGRLLSRSMSFGTSTMFEIVVTMTVASVMTIYVFSLEPRERVESPAEAEPE